MKTFRRSWWRQVKRWYWRFRAWAWTHHADGPYMGFNPWRVRIGEDEAAHGETRPWSEVKNELRRRYGGPDSRG